MVRRLDNFIGPWINVDVPGVKTLFDIMTNPVNPDNVVVVGEGGNIRVSTDAGVTWNIPGGNYLSYVPPNIYEVWFSDSNTIYTVGNYGACFKSTDGGLTFNSTVTFPTPAGTYDLLGGSSCFATHFPTPLMGIVSNNDNIYKTTDGGVTWTHTNGGLPINNPQTCVTFRGIHISSDGLTITGWGQGCVYRSTDGGNSYSMVLDFVYAQFSARPGEHLTWINDNILWGTTNQNEIFQSINAGASWTSLRTPDTSFLNSARIRAAHFYDSVNGFYSINTQIFSTNDWGISGTLSDSPAQEIWAVWTGLDQPCYTLTPCNGGLGFVTSTDLSLYVGQVVTLPGGNTCYTVGLANDCTGAIDIGGINQVYPDCTTCVPRSCYYLIPCDGVGPSYPVTGNFTPGTTVTVIEYPNQCFTVSDPVSPCDIGVPVTIDTLYDDCTCCLPPCPQVLTGTVSYYSGYSNLVKVSTDAGFTWTTRSVPTSPPRHLWDIMAFPGNPDRVVTVGDGGNIYLSVDQGVTWSQSSPVAYVGSTYAFEEVWHIDDIYSVVVGEELINQTPEPRFFKSIDGGSSYTQYPIIDNNGYVIFKFGQVICTHFLTPLIGVIGVQGIFDIIPGYPPPGTDEVYVLITLDGGLTWEVTNNKFPIAPLVPGTKPWGIKMSYLGSTYDITIVVDSGTAIYNSIDGGLTWNPFPLGGPSTHLTWLGTTLWETTLGGDIFISNDNGATWSSQQSLVGGRPYAAHFYNNLSTILGFYSADDKLYRTSDQALSGILSDTTPIGDVTAVWTEPRIERICPPDPPDPQTQSVDPYYKAFYRINDDPCTIETNELFCRRYYDLFKSLKYGIKTCSPGNLDDLWIQKTLLDIRSLAIDIPCCAPVSLPCCPEPEPCVYPTPLP